jgi:hypothetical protein
MPITYLRRLRVNHERFTLWPDYHHAWYITLVYFWYIFGTWQKKKNSINHKYLKAISFTGTDNKKFKKLFQPFILKLKAVRKKCKPKRVEIISKINR